jgi:hypothetical protein
MSKHSFAGGDFGVFRKALPSIELRADATRRERAIAALAQVNAEAEIKKSGKKMFSKLHRKRTAVVNTSSKLSDDLYEKVEFFVAALKWGYLPPHVIERLGLKASVPNNSINRRFHQAPQNYLDAIERDGRNHKQISTCVFVSLNRLRSLIDPTENNKAIHLDIVLRELELLPKGKSKGTTDLNKILIPLVGRLSTKWVSPEIVEMVRRRLGLEPELLPSEPSPTTTASLALDSGASAGSFDKLPACAEDQVEFKIDNHNRIVPDSWDDEPEACAEEATACAEEATAWDDVPEDWDDEPTAWDDVPVE